MAEWDARYLRPNRVVNGVGGLLIVLCLLAVLGAALLAMMRTAPIPPGAYALLFVPVLAAPILVRAWNRRLDAKVDHVVARARQQWAAEHGWTFAPQQEQIPPEVADLAAPRRMAPRTSRLEIAGTFQSYPATVQTWATLRTQTTGATSAGTPTRVSREVVSVDVELPLPPIAFRSRSFQTDRDVRPRALEGAPLLRDPLGVRGVLCAPQELLQPAAEALVDVLAEAAQGRVLLAASGDLVIAADDRDASITAMEWRLRLAAAFADALQQAVAAGRLPQGAQTPPATG